ncbi:MAG: DUF4197 domain-containing protein [Bacteroidales bacterium]|nr:DUF4197 domain-containing protein [Bacteroidales bacterium]
MIPGVSVSATDIWLGITKNYNSILKSDGYLGAKTLLELTGNKINLPKSIDKDLGEFSTGIALKGLFTLVGKQEKKIRKNPFEWAIDIIQKVFGSIFKEKQ